MTTPTKLTLGAVLSVGAALGLGLALLLGWSEAAYPGSFVFGFANGLLAGLGAPLALAGLIERQRAGR